ncbi:hypothetical protein B0H16DRAFT_1885519 [Mycena metata]|uniref:MYND-type domain-containing protein n=1 Tax=Mycena metata TaxID=1033252 RepID=A0AAD7J6N3_9AGAR|nr:hypothetical protein B0H16DRAFT_1885519 [Mycena metata]
MSHKYKNCGDPASKRCSGCTLSTAWYCSAECQRENWVKHIFECNPRRSITTTDHLARAVTQHLFPEDPQTVKDFGFSRAFSMENRRNLLGLYIGLIERLKVSPKKIQQWQAAGTLVPNIKATFEAIPWVLDPKLSPPSDPVVQMQQRAWQYIRGRPNTDTVDQIAAERSTWPKEKQHCDLLCNLILSEMHPPPELDELWVTFGFCACSEAEERILAAVYTELIQDKKCTFEELYHAYESSTLIALFDSKKLGTQAKQIPHLEVVLKGSPKAFQSVWYLKQFVASRDEGKRPIPSVTVDYGFMNCLKNEAERTLLKDLYRQVFALPHAPFDPMKLHEACIQGKLYEYVEGLLKLRKKDQKVLKRLLKNPYPLPDF